jgi:ketosteroid isomerase-like protein
MATTSATMEDATRAIRAIDLEFTAQVKAKDAARLVDACYAEDARVLPPNHPAVQGKAAIRELWQGLLASGVTDLALDTTHIEASGDLAYGVGAYLLHMEQAGGPRTEQQGKYCVVYRRDQGRWRVVADMFSPNE